MLILTAALGGTAILVSYVTVLGNVRNAFPLPARFTSSRGYLDSPYWVGLPRATAAVLAVFQVLAAIGFLMWLFYVNAHPPTRGLLKDPRWLLGSLLVFLVASAAWPFATYKLLWEPTSVGWAVGASVPLWLAAAAVIVLVGGTFEARYEESPVAVVGILLLALVVVLADGVGWAAAAIFKSLYSNDGV